MWVAIGRINIKVMAKPKSNKGFQKVFNRRD